MASTVEKNQVFLNDLRDAAAVLNQDCPIRKALTAVGGKWRLLVIGYLFTGEKRFHELSDLIPEISEKVLTQNLRALEELSMVQRRLVADVPPKTFYSLTEQGLALAPVISALKQFGERLSDDD